MEKINYVETFKDKRDINATETISQLRVNISRFWSWGAHAFTRIGKKALRFKVNGHHHKGHVYISVNGLDLYDVHITTTKGNIIAEINDLYCDQLAEIIDEKIEKIPEYVR